MSFHTLGYNQFESEQLSNSSLFSGSNGIPLLFYIPNDDPNRKIYKEKIIQYGGILTENEPTPANHIILISSRSVPGKVSFKPDYIDDSISQGVLVSLPGYQHEKANFDRVQRQPKSHNKFSQSKDEYILEQVRRNPRKRNSHVFFDQLAEHEPLREHSGNSIRSRYRAHLRPKLQFIYKTDANDDLIADSKGNFIRIAVDDFPYTLKNRFTSEDDYLLCEEILKFNVENKPVGLDRYADLTVPVSFFGNFIRNKKAKGHTVHSWRDRYRKFVSKYGVQNYIDYYEAQINEGKVPEPITNKAGKEITSEFRDLVGSSYRKASTDNREGSALDEEIGETKSSNIDRALLGKEQVSDQEQQDEDAFEDALSDTPSRTQGLLKINAVESKKGDRGGDKEEEGDDEDEEDVDEEQDEDEGLEESQVDTQSSQITIEYLDPSTKLQDVLNPNFFSYRDPNKLLGKFFEALNSRRNSHASALFRKFRKLGFNDNFTAHMVMATNGDVLKIKNFVEFFLNRLYVSINLDNFNEDELYKFLRIDSVNGIWNEESDSLLNTKNESKLLKVHSESQIKMRKNFLKALPQ